MEQNTIFKAKFSCEPLYREGDEFGVLEVIEDNPDLMPIKALRLRDKKIYFFTYDEV